MKHLTILALALLLLAPTAQAWDWPSKKTSADTAQTQKQGLGALIGGIVDAVKGKKGLSVADMEGTWVYQSPAVNFKSGNFLLKAGGAAAQGAIEDKIAPYYKAVGMDKLQLTVNADSTFSFKTRFSTINGTITPDPETDNAFDFEFKAFKKINIGKMTGNVAIKGDEMTVTYEAGKLLTLVEKIGKFTGMKSLNALSSLLGQYDGLTVGYKLKKQH